MAHGGIVRRPTLALIGESGPEAVVPLSQYQRTGTAGVTASEATTFNVTINGDVTEDRAQRIVEDFARAVRRGGRARTLAVTALGVG